MIDQTLRREVTASSRHRWIIESVAKESKEVAALRAQLAAVATAEGGPMDGRYRFGGQMTPTGGAHMPT